MMRVETAAGTIKVYKNTDPGAPGVAVMLQPKGFDYEIDLAFVEVKENPAYRVDGEGDGDVSVYMYGDPHTEDFTMKAVIKRNDVLEALEFEEVER